MTKVKICGITRLDDALAACDAGADAIGFVLAPEARARNRYIDPETAAGIVARLPAYVLSVGVVVNEPEERMREYLTFLDRLQLHGEEPALLCRGFGRRVYKSFRAGPDFSPRDILDYPGETCLLDAWSPGARGGTGVKVNWSVAVKTASLGKRLILAGGLAPENVAEAIAWVRPYAVDASGGLESEPGKKDHGRIRLFIRNVRHASDA